MGETSSESVRRAVRLDPIHVALGDVIVVAFVLFLGELRHGIDPVAEPVHIALTLGSFAVGLLVFAAIVGAYRPETYASLSDGLRTIVTAWVAGAAVGIVVRTSPVVAGEATWPFGVVVTGFPLIALVVWRALLVRYGGTASME